MEPLFFNSVSIEIPRENIYKRLGYQKGITQLSGLRQHETEEGILEAAAFVELKACAVITPIDKREGKTIFIGKINFSSGLVSSLLKDSREILFCAVTAGRKIIEEIKKRQKTNLTQAVIFDAVASEMADSGFDWIASYFNQELRRKNQCLTPKRISCGYADFAIENQKKIYDLLKLNKIGVTISSSFMLIPEKSATAVLGVVDI
jgi:hypothetical protein